MRAARVVTLIVAGLSALFLAVLAAPVGASTPGRANPGTQTVDGVRVILYSQMCDNGNQHSRLNVRNFNNHTVSVFVADPVARVTFTPGGPSSRPIAPGKGMLVHLVAAPNTPARNVTLTVEGGGTISFAIPAFNCVPTNPTVLARTTPRPNPVDPFVDAEVITAATEPADTTAAATTVKSGALAFTGSDTRFLAAVAALFVLLGAGFLISQVRLDARTNLLVGEDLPRRGILGPY